MILCCERCFEELVTHKGMFNRYVTFLRGGGIVGFATTRYGKMVGEAGYNLNCYVTVIKTND